MPREKRLVVPGCPHHLVLRANNRRKMFSYRSDFLAFVRFVAAALERSGCELHAAVLMKNHVHLIVTPPHEHALAAFVKSVAQRYAVRRNRQRDGSGKLFEQRYWSKPLLCTAAVAAVTAYVELNPVRAGLVRHPSEYLWSTYQLHVGGSPDIGFDATMWTPSRWYEALGTTRTKRSAAYLGVVADAMDVGGRDEKEASLHRLENLSASRYTRRLRRPNGRSAA